jgi:hypothetical protein
MVNRVALERAKPEGPGATRPLAVTTVPGGHSVERFDWLMFIESAEYGLRPE